MSNIKTHQGNKAWDGRFPHCDQRILHAPGECKFCDDCSLLQFMRQMWGINFTGHHDMENEHGHPMSPCPAEVARPLELLNRWHGNTPKTEKQLKEQDEAFEQTVKKFFEDKEETKTNMS